MASRVNIAGLTLDGVPVEMGSPASGENGYVVTDTWTVQINGVDTGVTVSLTDGSTDNDNQAVSAGYNGAFDLSVKQVGASGSSSNDVVVVGIY